MGQRKIPAGILVASLLFMITSVRGQLIDFETTPAGGAPTDDAFLSAPYNLTGGGTVAFFFDVNNNFIFDPGTDQRPVFEHAGNADPNSGFANDTTGIDDTANGGLASQLGLYFLRQLQPGTPPPQFIVDYNTVTPITGLKGEIWDIDGSPGNTEGWRVDVLDASNAILATDFSPPGNSSALDGLPWTFTFTGLPAGVDKLNITFIGTKTTGLGLAFNNFDPFNGQVPEPASVATLAAAATFLASRHRRR